MNLEERKRLEEILESVPHDQAAHRGLSLRQSGLVEDCERCNALADLDWLLNRAESRKALGLPGGEKK